MAATTSFLLNFFSQSFQRHKIPAVSAGIGVKLAHQQIAGATFVLGSENVIDYAAGVGLHGSDFHRLHIFGLDAIGLMIFFAATAGHKNHHVIRHACHVDLRSGGSVHGIGALVFPDAVAIAHVLEDLAVTSMSQRPWVSTQQVS